MSSTLGSLVVNLEANIARFTQDMSRASQQTEQAMSQISGAVNVAKFALGALGVALSVDALVGQANKAIGALADLDDMAQKTGASVENLSKLSQVAAMTGVEFGTVDAALVKLAKNMTTADEKGSKFKKAMDAIGISTKGIGQQDPSAVFVEIADKLQNYGDGAGKAALMTDAISKSAADLLPYMNDVSENIKSFTGATAEAAQAASKYQDDLGRMKVKYDQMVMSIVTGALPATNDFIGALSDVTNQSDGLVNIELAGWFDDAAVGLARVADVAILLPGLLSAVGGSFKVVGADLSSFVQIAAEANPLMMAKTIAQGGNPIENIKRIAGERNKVLEAANVKWDNLWNKPANQMEQAVLGRIDARAYGPASVSTPDKPKRKLAYTPGGDSQGKSDAEKALEEGERLVAKLKEQDEAYGLAGAALLEYQLASMKISQSLKDQALAHQVNIDAMKSSELASESFRREQQDALQAMEDAARRATEKNAQDVERIRVEQMSGGQIEAEAHATRMEALQLRHAEELLSLTEFNAMIEAENLRHEQVKAQIKMQSEQQIVGIAGDSASQLYNIMKQAGMEQTALGKALFIANKAIAVAEIIMNTEVAAVKALAMGGAAGIPLAMIVRVMGYASAGIVIGTTIASAEGGYDIPGGVNPVTQLHEKEMVLPRAQADVIRGLASRGGAGGAGDINQTFNISIDGTTDMERNQKMVYAAIQQGNAELVDRLVRAGRI
jgi:hypothetical protein